MPQPSITNALQLHHRCRSTLLIPVVKVSRWRWVPSSAYRLPNTLWCLKKKKPQFSPTQKLIFTFLWQKPGIFTGTFKALTESKTLVSFLFFFLRTLRAARLLNASLSKIGSLLFTCLCSLAVLFRTLILDMIYISTGHWRMRRLSWEKRDTSASVPWWNLANVLSLQNKKRQNKKSFFSRNCTFFAPLITLSAAMTDCTN